MNRNRIFDRYFGFCFALDRHQTLDTDIIDGYKYINIYVEIRLFTLELIANAIKIKIL